MAEFNFNTVSFKVECPFFDPPNYYVYVDNGEYRGYIDWRGTVSEDKYCFFNINEYKAAMLNFLHNKNIIDICE